MVYQAKNQKFGLKQAITVFYANSYLEEKRTFVIIGRVIITVKTLPLYGQFLVCYPNKELLNFLVMVNIEAQFYSAMKNINYLTELFMVFCCIAKLTQEMYHFRGLSGGFVGVLFKLC